ncbi:hypothetical protein BCR35DRAFT_305899 [Leucosporidium creatinivorum]|uniref:F-box domain-containing protein n=1 Tax=Leucosporidium creatinivorum TaxID=106004 RepID=A0A1Y2EXB2_9BASI|nr:hypothetical protein BCR35DRAFT_305899 [Leucosporidium creatinivorum]
MAVIQDLPPELLIRILELVPGADHWPDHQAMTRRTLAGASLVARDWRAPAQYLVGSTLQAVTNNDGWKRCLRAISDGRGSPPTTLERLLFVHGPDGAEQLAVLQRFHIHLRELHVFTGRLTITSAHYLLLQGLRRLKLSTPIEVHPSIEPSVPMILESLGLHASLLALPTFLLPLPAIVPRLTRLELNCTEQSFTSGLMTTLQAVAPQLTHLMVSLPFVDDLAFRRRCLTSLDSFLHTCTSVTSLRLLRPTPPEIKHVSSLLPKPLVLLSISLLVGHEGETRMPNEVAKLFDIPKLAQLRRWRMDMWVRGYGGGEGPLEGLGVRLSSPRD